jgi:hypothetical protein
MKRMLREETDETSDKFQRPAYAPASVTPRKYEPQGKDHLKSRGNDSDEFFSER